MCVCGGGNGDKLGRRLATLMMGRCATVPFEVALEVALDVDPHVYMLTYNGDPQDTLRQHFRRSSTTASIPR